MRAYVTERDLEVRGPYNSSSRVLQGKDPKTNALQMEGFIWHHEPLQFLCKTSKVCHQSSTIERSLPFSLRIEYPSHVSLAAFNASMPDKCIYSVFEISSTDYFSMYFSMK